ncbi:MAG: hypothetical protein sL5_00550 [Candidatus Mesenet longicola]|uniref:Uncharacterized protein n=1 Tax=Candidatus Mesenet longicola TaxID=1892558 RepID=A0A8J3HTQ9_9RICK|nr:MAG: hypothetical protein sGL2_00410 [Candidatus Mesenet longicola]GHM59062.1 MAG: hypothetical protein sL5_00550 [Candidatus Mesenet longicola]
MTDKCGCVIKLKWGDGKEIIDHIYKGKNYKGEDIQFFPIILLEPLSGREVATFPISNYYFDRFGYLVTTSMKYGIIPDKRDKDESGEVINNSRKSYFLKVEKNDQNKLDLSIYNKAPENQGVRIFGIEEYEIKNIDLERYANAEEPQIFIKQEAQINNQGRGNTSPVYVACLYDVDDNKIGCLPSYTVEHMTNLTRAPHTYFYGLYGKHDSYSSSGIIDGEIFISKVDGKYQMHAGEGSATHDALVSDLDKIIIDYDEMDKIMDNYNPYSQIENLTQKNNALCNDYNEYRSGLELDPVDCII